MRPKEASATIRRRYLRQVWVFAKCSLRSRRKEEP